jgi:hypothetical protein
LHSYELKRIQTSLDSGVTLSDAAVIQIRAIFSPTDRELQAANQRAILKALRFDMMDQRNDDITNASTETFEWLLKKDDNDVQEKSNPHLTCTFRNWLASSGGIFHISGKPGAGKSTLMKFLCNHEETMKQIEQWAGQKKLVFGKFFFWNRGTALQKNLNGLIRSLLYHILQHNPEFVVDLFPAYWTPDEYKTSTPNAKLYYISETEIRQAFTKLIQSNVVLANHRFCFFIDGLDEFEDKDYTWAELARYLNDLVDSTDDVKICVSSREFPVFESRFPANQRLRLQDLTKEDIQKFIQQKLEEAILDRQIYFQRLEKENTNVSKELERMVASKADGVFLWVALTLKLLCLAFDNHDSFASLEKSIDTIPVELDEFFQFILNSIPKHDRQRAYCKLHFVLKFPGTTYLIQFPFFDQCLENKKFAKNQEVGDVDVDDEEIANLLNTARAQVTGQCRGLLEVCTARLIPIKPCEHDLILKEEVRFTHRSIPEFLEKYLPMENFDVGEISIHTSIAMVKSISFPKHPEFTSLIGAQIHGVIRAQFLTTVQHFESLYLFDMVLCHRYPESRNTDWIITNIMSLPGDLRMPTISLLHTAAFEGYHEYLSWGIPKSPEIIIGRSGAELVHLCAWCVYHNIKFPEKRMSRHRTTLEILLRLGVNPNCPVNNPVHKNISVWELCVLSATFNGSFKSFWPYLETFLKHDADAPFWFHPLGEANEGKESELIITFGKQRYSLEDCSDSNLRLIDQIGAPFLFQFRYLPECLKAKGGRATLRDFFEMAFPESEVPAVLQTASIPVITTTSVPAEEASCETIDTVSSAPKLNHEAFSSLPNHITAVIANPATPWIMVGEFPLLPSLRYDEFECTFRL